MQKRDSKEKKYFPYKVPATYYCPLYIEDMDKIVNCADCLKELTFGMCYTSRTIHDDIGFGYGVCEECYHEESKLGPID